MMNKQVTRRRVAALLALLLLLLWWFWPGDSLARVHELQGQLFSDTGRALPAEERRELFAQLRGEMGKLSSRQRAALHNERMQRLKDRLDHYFAMSPDEQKAYLDQQINQSQQNQQQPPANGWGQGNGAQHA